MSSTNSSAVTNSPILTNSAIYEYEHKQHSPSILPNALILRECLKGHDYDTDTYAPDGCNCKQFIPSVDTCRCGLSRSFHRIHSEDDRRKRLKNHGAGTSTQFSNECIEFIPTDTFCTCGCAWYIHRISPFPIIDLGLDDSDD